MRRSFKVNCKHAIQQANTELHQTLDWVTHHDGKGWGSLSKWASMMSCGEVEGTANMVKSSTNYFLSTYVSQRVWFTENLLISENPDI